MSPTQKRLIGLTGGIATGKSTVSRYLAERYGLPILDADVYAREAVKLGSPILEQIFSRYGNQVQFPDGTLNRKELGEIIFNNSEEKVWLENQIHPYVRACFKKEIDQSKNDTLVLVIPLLFEAKLTHLVTEIWVVYCSDDAQIKRLKERDNLTDEQAKARIKNQLPIEQKVAAADLVLDNSSDLNSVFRQIDQAIKINDE
ncbi:dephospho-CoA kinase [Gloeothece citriformis PCC 7424]|uniref:Dephospho-CoA kinase n=1 Tax=Gloeothece citriformis (strain PCC 7424) TaxID=65393 RepID=B7KCM3_GLOC7|nr:dephospho-CoA kinase [Gloeothece citriformis]ACK71574.1 dephospho-CoA kinase [Gloeothece citriformis PCC 7424]